MAEGLWEETEARGSSPSLVMAVSEMNGPPLISLIQNTLSDSFLAGVDRGEEMRGWRL